MAIKKRRGKYNVAPKRERTYNGTVYMSKLEMKYRKYLDLLTKARGEAKVISIEEQVPYPVYINDIKVFTYLLDFKVIYKGGVVELIDTKGVVTDIYRLKKKCVEAYYGIKIKEVKDGEF